jgi:hypothetical protein
MPTFGQASAATFDILRTVAFGSITGSYLPLGTPFAHAVRLMAVNNTANTDMILSIDGVHDYLYLPAGTFKLYDVCTNRETACNFYIPIGTQWYVKYASAPASGAVYLECIYGVGE